MAKKIVAAMSALAVCATCEAAASVTVAYILYDDGSVAQMGPERDGYKIGSPSITWPFTKEEAKELLQAKANGLL